LKDKDISTEMVLGVSGKELEQYIHKNEIVVRVIGAEVETGNNLTQLPRGLLHVAFRRKHIFSDREKETTFSLWLTVHQRQY
jgi:hypothetical protein